MQFDHLNFNEDDGLMSIEDLRALRLRKKKIESDKKARKYILDINQRYSTHFSISLIYIQDILPSFFISFNFLFSKA